MTAQEFFATLPDKADPSKTAGMHNTYVFDVEGVGQWTVAVDDGTVKSLSVEAPGKFEVSDAGTLLKQLA